MTDIHITQMIFSLHFVSSRQKREWTWTWTDKEAFKYYISRFCSIQDPTPLAQIWFLRSRNQIQQNWNRSIEKNGKTGPRFRSRKSGTRFKRIFSQNVPKSTSMKFYSKLEIKFGKKLNLKTFLKRRPRIMSLKG